MAKKRTTMRSKAGKKLYAVRNEQGEFTDIQTYQRAHSADLRQKSKAELEAAAKKKKTAKKAKPAKAVKKKKATAPAKTVKKKAKKAAQRGK